MTVQDAIRTMEYFDREFGGYIPNHEAIQMAIEALNFVSEYHQRTLEVYAHDMGVSLEQAERELRVEPNKDDSGSVDSEQPEIKTDRTIGGMIYRQDVIDMIQSVPISSGMTKAMLMFRAKELPSAQPDKDMLHLQREQAYTQGWEDGRKALREEIWEDERDRLD